MLLKIVFDNIPPISPKIIGYPKKAVNINITITGETTASHCKYLLISIAI
jgi:hypothetical protein